MSGKLLILAGWINRRQQKFIEYLITENRVLREKLGKKQIALTMTGEVLDLLEPNKPVQQQNTR
jgi:hypothetical protein